MDPIAFWLGSFAISPDRRSRSVTPCRGRRPEPAERWRAASFGKTRPRGRHGRAGTEKKQREVTLPTVEGEASVRQWQRADRSSTERASALSRRHRPDREEVLTSKARVRFPGAVPGGAPGALKPCLSTSTSVIEISCWMLSPNESSGNCPTMPSAHAHPTVAGLAPVPDGIGVRHQAVRPQPPARVPNRRHPAYREAPWINPPLRSSFDRELSASRDKSDSQKRTLSSPTAASTASCSVSRSWRRAR